MKYKSRGVALTYIKQGETSIISKIFTEEKGLQSFIVKGSRSKKSKKRIGFFEPLRLINIEATYISKNSLQYLGDISIAESFNTKTNNLYNNFIAVFIAEVSSKILQENEQNRLLFNFFWITARKLFVCKKIDENFVLEFMLNLSEYLGFLPSIENSEKPYFCLERGGFSENSCGRSCCLDKELSMYLKKILTKKKITIPQKQKSELLKKILHYYTLHHYNLDHISSHIVIESLRK